VDQPAISPALPLHADIGEVPTNQQSPSAGCNRSGSSATPCTTGCIKKSSKSKASLWNNSLCACPTASKGRPKRGVCRVVIRGSFYILFHIIARFILLPVSYYCDVMQRVGDIVLADLMDCHR